MSEADSPLDYEACGECGFDHSYEYVEAAYWHQDNPCSYCHLKDGEHADNCPAKGYVVMYKTIREIREANRELARVTGRSWWFDPGAMSFFSSRIHDKVYGGKYFITSEQYEATDYGKTLGFKDGPRKYSVRICHPNGSIDTCGEHMAYHSVEECEEVIKKLMKQ